MSGIKLEGISLDYGNHLALKDVELEIKQGEFFSLLGPSGCGKSTLLNIIAGFLGQTTGVVYIGDEDVTNIPPYKRNLGMVFQNYALFPHLSVRDNVAYGLKNKKMSKKDIKKKVDESLALVQLDSYATRMPHQLSGGQQQRVAIARALAIEPSVLLLDEPLSNLDAKLRKEMQFELRRIQKSVGITTVLVTHDQEEALSLSDRIGILGDGVLQQVGEPLEVYRRPANRFVAEFIGQVNIFDAELREGTVYETTAGFKLEAERHESGTQPERVRFMLRPERIFVEQHAAGAESANRVRAIVKESSYIGNAIRIRTEAGGIELAVHAPDPLFPVLPAPGEELMLSWNKEDIIYLEVLDHESN
ncbi:ABC transporter ATP-binding protein [Terribacillus saccharophilus]|uniref:ABC transporter ATP-binding protein n=1 Tax=Terribacillus saccharophilus TaxID=361277 RepID=UPI003981C1B1